ncbi:MAG: EamA family transporter RarD [Actinomycetota bacterium]|nr:EamA family transporter RarD [Actinomycetota bacterium]
MTEDHHDERRGVIYGVAAYLLWGLAPLYFPLLEPANPVEIVGHRIVWSLVVVGTILAVGAGFRPFLALLRDRRRAALIAAAAVLVGINWGVYVYAVNSEHVIEAALGYFVNPLVSAAFGVLVFRERLRPAQAAAFGLGLVAVIVLTVDYGRLPWIALTLAFSFGTYGLAKKLAGVGSAEGLALETLILLAPALGYLLLLEANGTGTFAHESAGHTALLISAGAATALPLLLFSASVTRVPLTVIGMLQYLTPTIQFLVGLLVFGEDMPASRWIGFGLVWAALALLSADALRAGRRARAEAPEPALA